MYKLHILKNVSQSIFRVWPLLTTCAATSLIHGIIAIPPNWFLCFSFCSSFPILLPPSGENLLEFESVCQLSPQIPPKSFPFPLRGYKIPLTWPPARFPLLYSTTQASILLWTPGTLLPPAFAFAVPPIWNLPSPPQVCTLPLLQILAQLPPLKFQPQPPAPCVSLSFSVLFSPIHTYNLIY